MKSDQWLKNILKQSFIYEILEQIMKNSIKKLEIISKKHIIEI